jgi:hypothetical protein
MFVARDREGGERFASGIKNVIDLANGSEGYEAPHAVRGGVKSDEESLASYVRRKAGINACADHFTKELGRQAKTGCRLRT